MVEIKSEALDEILRICRLLCYYKHSDEQFKIEIETLKTALAAYDKLPPKRKRKL